MKIFLSSLHAKYASGLILLSLFTLHQPIIINAELNGVEACENRCYNQSECSAISNGFCCQWDSDHGQCMSNIGQSLCPQTNNATIPNFQNSQSSIACRLQTTSISMEASNTTTTRGLSDIAKPVTSFSPTSCDDIKSGLDYQICKGLSRDQVTSHIIISKITAALSILGSSYVIQDIVRNPEKRNESIYHRLMFGLSCSDVIFSFFGWFLSTWVMPKESHLFAVGSESTCIASGFFHYMTALSTPLYNCSLATFYFLQLRLNWTKRKIMAIEKWFHILPWTVGLIGAITAAALSSLGPYLNVCW